MTAPLVLLGQGANVDAVDSWTPVHAITGLAAGAFGVPLPWALGGAIAYEALEYLHESPRGSVFFGSKRPESLANVAVDLVVFLAAWWVGTGVR